MSGNYSCCQKCGKLYIDSNLKECVEKVDGEVCGGELKKGIENISYEGKKDIAAHERKLNNESVRRQYGLKPKKGPR